MPPSPAVADRPKLEPDSPGSWSRKLYLAHTPDQSKLDERAIERFERWRANHQANPAAAPLDEGIALAQARRNHLKELIKQNPQAAWEAMLSDAERRNLPAALRPYLEQSIEGAGDWDTYAICFSDLPFSEYREAVFGENTTAERRFHAFAVGRLVEADSARNISLRGYAIDDVGVFDGDPVLAGPAAAPGESETGQPDSLPFTDRLDGIFKGGLSLDYRTLLYMRCTFADEAGSSPQTESAAYSMLRSVNDHLIDSSYGRMQILLTVTPLIVLPQNHQYYIDNGTGTLMNDALVEAQALGYATGNYGHRVVRYSGGPGTFGGLAQVGANPGKVWMRGNWDSVLVHELGHNFKLHHSSSWDTNSKAAIGPSGFAEYGHKFDIMGSGASYSKGRFCSYHKQRLGWLKDSEYLNPQAGGRFRLHSIDDGKIEPDKRYALELDIPGRGNYWLEYRNNYTTNAFKNGVLLQARGSGWADNSTKACLIDVTYWSKDGKDDATIPLGWTFSDYEHGIHVTPLSRNGALDRMDVQVHRGDFPDNRPPQLILAADRTNVSKDEVVAFTATATDPDGDELAYHWYFDDNDWHRNQNQSALTTSWGSNRIYNVVCTVTDMKGGISVKWLPVTVGGTNGYFTIAGRVTDHAGAGVRGAPIDNDKDRGGSDYRVTLTDDDGNFLLTRCVAGDHTLKCRKDYDEYATDFSNPVTVGPSATGMDFTARALRLVAVGASLNENGGAAEFRIERVGGSTGSFDVNVGFRGAAVEGTDYTLSPAPTGGQYNLPAGTASLTIAVTGKNDSSTEGPEDVVMTLSMTNDLSVIGPQTVASLTIEDDDTALPRVTAEPLDLFLNENGGTAQILVSRHGPTDQPLTVKFGTATNYDTYAKYQDDFTFDTGAKNITIPAGAASAILVLQGVDDPVIQENDEVKFWVATDSAYVKDSADMFLPLIDDDYWTVSVTAIDAVGSEPDQNPAVLRFTRTGGTDEELAVDYALSGTALHGTDFLQLAGKVTFPAGLAHVDLTVLPLLDAIDENTETVKVWAASGAKYFLGADRSDTVDILADASQDEMTVTIVPGDVAAEAGPQNGSFVVRRSDLGQWPFGDAVEDDGVWLQAETSGGDGRAMGVHDVTHATLTPNAGSTYYAQTADSWFRGVVAPRLGGLTVEAGVYTVSFHVGDNDPAADLFTQVTQGGQPVSAAGTIGLLAGHATGADIENGEANLLEIKDTGVTAVYNASAVPADGEWARWTITYRMPAGSPLIGQPLGFMLKKPGNMDAKCVLAFDGPLTVDFVPANPPNEPFTGDLTLDYLLEGGTATAGADYQPLSGTVTIPDGASSAAITIAPLTDALVEGDETLIVSLTPKTGYIVGWANRAAQIILDDVNTNPSFVGADVNNTSLTPGKTLLDVVVGNVSDSEDGPAQLTVSVLNNLTVLVLGALTVDAAGVVRTSITAPVGAAVGVSAPITLQVEDSGGLTGFGSFIIEVYPDQPLQLLLKASPNSWILLE